MTLLRTILCATDQRLKRCVDIALGAAACALLVPATPLIAAAIKLDSHGPTFFRCARLGRSGNVIKLVKFRTMIHNAPDRFQADGSRLVEAADSRVTRVGAVLRGGLDELPQAWSVLRGDLSFIGPRPDDVFAIDMYRDAEWLKLSVTPGITGLAQVHGRNELPYRERLKYDVYYALHRTLALDIQILVRTLLLAAGVVPTTPLVPAELIEAVVTDAAVIERALQLAQDFHSNASRATI